MFVNKIPLATAMFLIAFVLPAYAQHIYVANAGEDTVSKIDINTNQEVARYATWFTPGKTNHVPHLGSPNVGPAPSRLLEDSAGNLFVLNRFFNYFAGTATVSHLPVLVKIAPTGGTTGTTSSGPTALPIDDVNNNKQIDPGEATDVRILWAKEIGLPADLGPNGALGRALCMDTSGILWVGLNESKKYYRVDPVTGNMLGPGISTGTHKPYGCQVDQNGKLWSVDSGNSLLEINTATGQQTLYPHAGSINYSLSIWNDCSSAASKVYLSEWSPMSPKTYIVYDPATSSFSNSLTANPFRSLSVAVDQNGNIISGEYQSTGRVIKSTPAGTVIWDTTAVSATNTVMTSDLHGIIRDKDGNVWAVHRNDNRVVKYSGLNGQWLATVQVGNQPYTYSNPPPPTCPCVETSGSAIECDANNPGTYSWSFTLTNHSPFLTPATGIDLFSSQVTNLTPSTFQFPNPVGVNGQATVSGTFTVANPTPGKQVCMDVQLGAGRSWCCPRERVCFTLPECRRCARLDAGFKCVNGQHVLQLTIINQGPTTAQQVQVFSTTPGVTVSPQLTTQTLPPNTPVTIPLTVTGAAPGQSFSLSVNVGGPVDPRTGVTDWCCTNTVTVVYPKTFCAFVLDGGVFNDHNRNGVRDSVEEGLSGWTVTLSDAQGRTRSTNSGANGLFRFENVDPGVYRISPQAPAGWRATMPEAGNYTVNVTGRVQTFEFGFAKVVP